MRQKSITIRPYRNEVSNASMKKYLKAATIYIAVWVIVVTAVFPFLWMFSSSLKSVHETFSIPPRLIPEELRFDNFVEVFSRVDVLRSLANSAIYALGSVALYLVIAPLAGYALAKYTFPGRQLIFLAVLATMMIPIEVLLVPLFKLLINLRWLNTYHGLILPRVVEPFGIFLLKQHFSTIPDDYLDAARIDGCSEFGIFRRIMIPLSSGPLAVTGLFMFTWRWNELLWPLIVANRHEMHTIPVGIAMFIREWYVEWNYLFALCTVAIVPIIILFICLQKYFMEGAIMSGIKG
jgi:ABC-type glycerol-3-phosphate transport system permease component